MHGPFFFYFFCKYILQSTCVSLKQTICHSTVVESIGSANGKYILCDFCFFFLIFLFTCKNVLPSSRNKRNGTSKSIALRNSVHPLVVRYCAPDTAHIGALIPITHQTIQRCNCKPNRETFYLQTFIFCFLLFWSATNKQSPLCCGSTSRCTMFDVLVLLLLLSNRKFISLHI